MPRPPVTIDRQWKAAMEASTKNAIADFGLSPRGALSSVQLCEAALELAARIAENGPLAVRVSKQILRESRGWSMDERYDRQAQLIGPVFVSADAREGSLAFAEKRKPNWTGK